METKPSRVKYLFVLLRSNPEAARIASSHLRELGVRVLNRHGTVAIVGLATSDQAEAAVKSGLFAAVTRESIKSENRKKLPDEVGPVLDLWNFQQSEKFRRLKKDRSQRGKKWGDRDHSPEPPHTFMEPQEFKQVLLKQVGVEEKELKRQYKGQTPKPLEGDNFIAYEQELARRFDNPTIAYHLARMAYHLDPVYQLVIMALPEKFFLDFFAEPACWKMEGEISVGIVFVESSENGPKFSNSERTTLQAEIADGLDWLALQAPIAAHLVWVLDWQFTHINAPDQANPTSEDYWRNPAMGRVNYQGHTYTSDWNGVAAYREDMRVHNRSNHAIVIFVTPYGNNWHAYAGGGRVTLANHNDWGHWGIHTIDMITAHEVCHLFGAADEYTGSGTPCSSCSSLHGCYLIPNGNCGTCASPQQDCVMDSNQDRLCAYTQGHIGWADLFVELTTGDVMWAGTDDDVWLDIGDQTFVLDTANHNDRERGNVEGYALNYTGVQNNDIKRIGIRKSEDGFAGGWYLKRVRVWLKGKLICDADNINQWLEDEYRWWYCGSCGTSKDIVNRLQVQITTGDVMWAGTDDDVEITLGGRKWNLDNPSHDDFERGNTDTFNLDPGASLYKSMITTVRVHKSSDGVAGGWKFQGLQISINGANFYTNNNVNKWLEDDDRDWFGNIP